MDCCRHPLVAAGTTQQARRLLAREPTRGICAHQLAVEAQACPVARRGPRYGLRSAPARSAKWASNRTWNLSRTPAFTTTAQRRPCKRKPLDGIYVIRTNVPRMRSRRQAVGAYKSPRPGGALAPSRDHRPWKSARSFIGRRTECALTSFACLALLRRVPSDVVGAHSFDDMTRAATAERSRSCTGRMSRSPADKRKAGPYALRRSLPVHSSAAS